jgi:hypothetical protein
MVEIDESLYRFAEVDLLIGCADKAAQELKWVPRTTLEGLVELMMKSDLDELGVSAIPKRRGSVVAPKVIPPLHRPTGPKPLTSVSLA